MFVFIQCFSLADVGGGPRILRSVADNAPVSVASICTGFGRNQSLWKGLEMLVPFRPALGRLDRTRFAWLGGYVESLWTGQFEQKLERQLQALGATDVHLLPHSWGDFAGAFRVAKRLRLRMHVSIHDDFTYTAGRHPKLRQLERMLGDLWWEAKTCFVISQEMGEEYCRRYGDRPFLVHTDGFKDRPRREYQSPTDEVKLYFMGMFNHSYVPNFRAILKAMESRMAKRQEARPIRFTIRTHGFNPEVFPGKGIVESLPFASSDVVEREMRSQDFLYLPLPFEEEWQNLCKFSLSTKMVSYLGAGVPIIYHGPASSAAGQYLLRSNAAIQLNSNEPEEIATTLENAFDDASALNRVSENAQNAVRRDFDAAALKRRFWDAIL
jgi:hypothetical protein